MTDQPPKSRNGAERRAKPSWPESNKGIWGMLGGLGLLVLSKLKGALILLKAVPIGKMAYKGAFLNLFNLTPLSPLDGGRIVQAFS